MMKSSKKVNCRPPARKSNFHHNSIAFQGKLISSARNEIKDSLLITFNHFTLQTFLFRFPTSSKVLLAAQRVGKTFFLLLSTSLSTHKRVSSRSEAKTCPKPMKVPCRLAECFSCFSAKKSAAAERFGKKTHAHHRSREPKKVLLLQHSL